MRGNLRSSGAGRRARTSRVARVHRTTTTATLLVTVAVSALTGCTTVRGPAPADPSVPGARSSAPRPDGPAEPRVVQAPAREALEMIGPSPDPERAGGQPRRTKPPAAPSAPHRPPAARAPERRPARPAAPEHTRPPATSRPRAPELPGVSGGGTGGKADVCSLGKQYGGWRPGSPEARICEQAYGR
ncbi:Lipoprotein OS=Streptomyces tendae OX=1932 GN=GUR47_30315 PE=4 SV=1 [Streptomyces tendae]